MTANGNGHRTRVADLIANATPPTLTVQEARTGMANQLLRRSHELLGENMVGRDAHARGVLLRAQIIAYLASSSAEAVERSGRRGVPHRSGRSMGGVEE